MRVSELDPHGLALIPLIGSPVSAAVAPFVYNRVFDEYDINAVSMPIEIRPDQLGEFLASSRLLGIAGFVLTSPLKSAIIPLLDEVDQKSRLFSSVNVVKVVDGRFVGRGLDGAGVIGAFDARGVDLRGKRVLMLGSGGVGGVLASGFAERGAARLTILNRTVQKARTIGKALQTFSDIEVEVDTLTPENLNRIAPNVDIVLQATTLGMKSSSQNWTDLDFLERLHEDVWVMEAVSNPLRTSLVQAAESLGLNVILGMDMMVEQLAELFSYLLDIDLPDGGKDIARSFYRERFN